MNFKCINTRAGKCLHINGSGQDRLRLFRRLQTVELIIHTRGSCMDTIIGKYRIGLYVCIPGINAGCSISSMSDFFKNRERLSELMNQTDAITVALKAAASCWGSFKDA